MNARHAGGRDVGLLGYVRQFPGIGAFFAHGFGLVYVCFLRVAPGRSHGRKKAW